MSPATSPSRINLRAYQVGFGDCFLLSFAYRSKLADARNERHVLIDFGSTRWPPRSGLSHAKVAEDIAKRTEGKLDAVVVTHRHKDHLSGFADKEAQPLIAALEPDLVVRPWTEDPKASSTATGPLDEGSRQFAAGLDSAQEFAKSVTRVIPDDADRRSLRGRLWNAADDQLANKAAIDFIAALGDKASIGHVYVRAGADSKLGKVLPGVEVKVLGPPTVKQWPEVAGQRADDPDYWVTQRSLLERMLKSAKTAGVPTADPTVKRLPPPGPTRWIVEKMADQHAHSLLRIVRSLDDALNNTSVILQFKTRRRHLLFPGDAQIENWSYALDPKHGREPGAELDAVDLYKVGHHGSRNATPKSLYARWEKSKAPFAAVMSTLPGVHGGSKETRVPLDLLTDALAKLGPLYRTDELAKRRPFVEITASTSTREPFRVSDD